MPDVLRVPATKLSHPVTFLVLMVAYDGLLHRTLGFEMDSASSWAIGRSVRARACTANQTLRRHRPHGQVA